MNRSFHIPSINILLNRQPGLVEIQSLLDLLPQAAILIEAQNQNILLANSKATELTSFTRAELTAQDLKGILPNLSQRIFKALFPDSEPLNDRLQTRHNTSIDVQITYHRLNSQGPWGLILLETVAAIDNQRAERARQTNRLENLIQLVDALQKTDSRSALEDVLKACQNLIGASSLAIYVIQACEPVLRRITSLGDVDILPEMLSLGTMKSLFEPVVWIPGKRAAGDLHRAARIAKMTYLGSFPLGESEAVIGLLVFGSKSDPLPEDYQQLMEIVSAIASAIIQQLSYHDHLLSNENLRSRQLFIGETIKNNSSEGIIILSPDLIIQELNPSAENLLGYVTQDVCGQPVNNILIGPNNLIPALQAAQQGISTPNLGDVRLHRSNGETFLAHISTIPLFDSERLEGVLTIVRDLSEHEQSEIRNQQLEQRALLGEVNAIFAHEVRNPINNISTGLQLMELSLPPEDPNREVIGRLREDCNRLTHLTDSILAFSKQPSSIKFQPVNISELITNLLERWRPRLARLNITHEMKTIDVNALVFGDPRNLEQVFSNLIGNAVEAMSKTGGNLSINIRLGPPVEDREQVEINVIDNGPGIPKETIGRIFEPFFTTNRNGTGLGLAIAKRIINTHKGTISVSSVPGGTVFQVRLPKLKEG